MVGFISDSTFVQCQALLNENVEIIPFVFPQQKFTTGSFDKSSYFVDVFREGLMILFVCTQQCNFFYLSVCLFGCCKGCTCKMKHLNNLTNSLTSVNLQHRNMWRCIVLNLIMLKHFT